MIRKKAKQKRMKYSDNERVTQTKSNFILYAHITLQILRMKDKRVLIKRRQH